MCACPYVILSLQREIGLLRCCRCLAPGVDGSSEHAIWSVAFTGAGIPAAAFTTAETSLRLLVGALQATAAVPSLQTADEQVHQQSLRAVRQLERLKAAIPTDGKDALAQLSQLAGSSNASLLVAQALLLAPQLALRTSGGSVLGTFPAQCVSMSAHILSAVAASGVPLSEQLDDLTGAVRALCPDVRIGELSVQAAGIPSSTRAPAVASYDFKASVSGSHKLLVEDADRKVLCAALHNAGAKAPLNSASRRRLQLLEIAVAVQRSICLPCEPGMLKEAAQRAAAATSDIGKGEGTTQQLASFAADVVALIMKVSWLNADEVRVFRMESWHQLCV